MKTPTTLAERLRTARKQRNLTQTDLARRAGLNQSTLSKLERGEVLETAAIARIADVLRVPAPWLELGRGAPPSWADGAMMPHVSARDSMMEPLRLQPILRLRWEDLRVVELPTRFQTEIPDDAVAPLVRAGAVATFDTTIAPRGGDGILVQDGAGGMHFRRYRPGVGDEWEAFAMNEAFPTLRSSRDGLRLMAVFVGAEHRLG